MAGAAVGVIAKEGGASVATEAQVGSLFGKCTDPASINKVMDFVKDKNISSEGLEKAFKKTFDEFGGQQHHTDPAQALINTLERMIKFATRVDHLASVFKSPSVLKTPDPANSAHKPADHEQNNTPPASKKSKSPFSPDMMKPRPPGFKE